MAERTAKFSRIMGTRLWDFAAAAPMIAICTIGGIGFFIQAGRQWPSQFHFPMGLQIASESTSGVFLLFQAVLLCIRRLPSAKLPGLAPRVWAMIGTNFPYTILLVPKALPTATEALVSAALTLAGTAAAIWVLASLGKAFAVFPQARELVTTGPYKIVRHPLYLAEQVSAFGLALQFQQPWALLIMLVGFAAQFPRMRYEENILAATFADYRSYESHTARIIPFLY